MKYYEEANNIILTDCPNFSLADTLDCGQAFRFSSKGDLFCGVIGDRFVSLKQDNEKITFFDTSISDFEDFFIDYFDLNRDYSEIIDFLSRDEVLKEASDFSRGIRILRQDIWETVCSFIISQNNNIPRIKGIIDRLCFNFGEKIGDTEFYSFPSAEKISKLSPEALAPIRSGFRAKYIIDAAKKVSENQIDIDGIFKMPSETAKEELKKIAGVGDKVASCILLFAFGRMDVLPKDVWIKRALNFYYRKEEFPSFVTEKGYDGIAQQYLFHYARKNASDIFKK